MKKAVKIVLSLILIIALFPKTGAKAGTQSLDKCNITDSIVGNDYIVYDLNDDSDSNYVFSYSIPDNGAAVLIFFQPGCWNCQTFFDDLAQSNLIADEKVKLIAVEISNASKADTMTFINSHLQDKKNNIEVYCGGGCSRILWSYAELIYGQINSLTTPLILVISGSGDTHTICSYSEGYISADELEKNLPFADDIDGHTDTGVALPDPEYTLRDGDNTSYHGDEDVVIGLEGTFASVDETAKQTILQRINEIRKEACDNGYPYPDNRSKNLTPSDYVPIKWSGLIEKIAAIRAAEASVLTGHQRLSAKESSVFFNGYNCRTYAEVLAWNFCDATVEGIIYGIEQFYDEKQDWLDNTPGAVTGHYTSMIDPGNTYVGMAGFQNDCAAYRFTVAAQFSKGVSLDEGSAGVGGKVYQEVKVDRSFVTGLQISCKKSLIKPGKTVSAAAIADIAVNYYGDTSCGHGPVISGAVWESSDTSVANVDENGVITGIGTGSAVITVSIGDLVSASFDISVKSAEDHDLVYHKGNAATHFEPGNIEYWECTDCGALFSDSECDNEITADDAVIPVIPHVYNILRGDQNGHRRECECGDMTEYSAHTYDENNVCTVCGYVFKIYGDINNDGEANNKDVVFLFRYVSSGGTETAYDFNTDGEVNNKDVVALFRFISV